MGLSAIGNGTIVPCTVQCHNEKTPQIQRISQIQKDLKKRVKSMESVAFFWCEFLIGGADFRRDWLQLECF